MTETFHAGDGVLFMKVGTHANEPLDEIFERKRREIDEAGFAMWGYGGNTCHPRTMVQPFAHEHRVAGRPIRLVMEPMNSKHFAAKLRADQFSVDGFDWSDIPNAINVLGSRYALCIRDLRETDSELTLSETRVALGNSMGKSGDLYVRGRVDKACLDVVGRGHAGPVVEIGLVADLVEPYAVFLRNT
jgi:hypothetical protein